MFLIVLRIRQLIYTPPSPRKQHALEPGSQVARSSNLGTDRCDRPKRGKLMCDLPNWHAVLRQDPIVRAPTATRRKDRRERVRVRCCQAVTQGIRWVSALMVFLGHQIGSRGGVGTPTCRILQAILQHSHHWEFGGRGSFDRSAESLRCRRSRLGPPSTWETCQGDERGWRPSN